MKTGTILCLAIVISTSVCLASEDTSALRQRILDENIGWTTGPITVCIHDSVPAQIYNPQDQYLQQHELNSNGQEVVIDLGFFNSGFINFQLTGDVLGQHMLRAEGSLSGLSPDIITFEVIPCYPTESAVSGSADEISQSPGSRGTMSGFGNSVDQSNANTAYGRRTKQTASNWANVVGYGNKVNQGINQNVFGSGTAQTKGNRADIYGTKTS